MSRPACLALPLGTHYTLRRLGSLNQLVLILVSIETGSPNHVLPLPLAHSARDSGRYSIDARLTRSMMSGPTMGGWLLAVEAECRLRDCTVRALFAPLSPYNLRTLVSLLASESTPIPEAQLAFLRTLPCFETHGDPAASARHGTTTTENTTITAEALSGAGVIAGGGAATEVAQRVPTEGAHFAAIADRQLLIAPEKVPPAVLSSEFIKLPPGAEAAAQVTRLLGGLGVTTLPRARFLSDHVLGRLDKLDPAGTVHLSFFPSWPLRCAHWTRNAASSVSVGVFSACHAS